MNVPLKSDPYEPATSASESWKASARAAVAALAKANDFFTTDEVWFRMKADGTEEAPEPRALGAVMRAAAKHGVIAATREYSKSVRPECHDRPLRVWRSLVRR